MLNKKIGLSLGADLCWPAAYEALLRKIGPIHHKGSDYRFDVERVLVEPYDLKYKPKYDLVLDRVTHWHPISREWIKKITLMDDVYVLNNPWAIQSMEKHTSYCAMMRLGFPVPETWMIPSKDVPQDHPDMEVTVNRYNRLFSLSTVGESVGYPAFIKPYDGGGWVGVKRVTNHDELSNAYDASGARVNHLQAGVKDWDVFVRGIGIGPQVNIIRYDPSAALHNRYVVDFHFLEDKEWMTAIKTTRVINAFFNWDFNSCEMLRSGGVMHPIDFANACPDSQVTSLHYHFPQLVLSLLRWSVFCTVTNRKVKLNHNWQPYFDIADLDLPFEEKLERYDSLAREHFDFEAYNEFSELHYGELLNIAIEFFASSEFYDIVEDKVSALFPPHEVAAFTDHFFGMIQFWRKTELERITAEQQ